MTDSVPTIEFVGLLRVEVGVPVDGQSASEGLHRSVEIVGGTLEGVLGEGTILPGGVDRQIVHTDGSISIDAHYEIELVDSTIVTVRSVGVRAARADEVYFRTGIRLTTVNGRPEFDHHLFISTGYRAESTVVLELYRLS